MKNNFLQSFVITVVLLYVTCIYMFYQPNVTPAPAPAPILTENSRKIWASMGLCYSHNTQLLGKSRYPYKDVAPLALLLWQYHVPEVNLLVRIVYTEPRLSSFMSVYGAMLERTGAVVEWIPAGTMDCVTKSQLVRLFASENENVSDDDIVMTVDINLFVMNRNVTRFISEHPDMEVWIPQYYDSAFSSSGTGETFNQNLIAMKGGTWKKLTEYHKFNGSLEAMTDHFRNIGLVGDDSVWYTDQLISTYGLLKHQLCNVPETSGLWNLPKLDFDPSFSDENLCWHGRGYKDCNRDVHIVYQGCKWWHFFPDQGMQDHIEKFHELTNYTTKIDLKVLVK